METQSDDAPPSNKSSNKRGQGGKIARAEEVGGGGGHTPPCGACKFLRRKCISGCIFSPYFSSEQGAARFAAVHKVFGASNVSKLLVHIPAHRRHDAVVTISYEAQARLSDPVYGCVSTILALQQQVALLQAELSLLQAQLMNSRLLVANALQGPPQHQHLIPLNNQHSSSLSSHLSLPPAPPSSNQSSFSNISPACMNMNNAFSFGLHPIDAAPTSRSFEQLRLSRPPSLGEEGEEGVVQEQPKIKGNISTHISSTNRRKAEPVYSSEKQNA